MSSCLHLQAPLPLWLTQRPCRALTAPPLVPSHRAGRMGRTLLLLLLLTMMVVGTVVGPLGQQQQQRLVLVRT